MIMLVISFALAVLGENQGLEFNPFNPRSWAPGESPLPGVWAAFCFLCCVNEHSGVEKLLVYTFT